MGRGLGGEELSPSQALTSQAGVVVWGALQPSLEGQAAVTNLCHKEMSPSPHLFSLWMMPQWKEWGNKILMCPYLQKQ